MPSAEDQAIEFFIKRAELASEIASRHCKDNEFEKGINLYKQAYTFYLKAQKSHPDDEELKAKIHDIKLRYQEAKKMLLNPANSKVKY